MTENRVPNAIETDFSLVLGGPLYQAFLRSRVLRPPLDLLRRRLVVLTLLAWAPLLLLSAAESHLLSGVATPFRKDLETQVRFLVALPLLVVAEKMVHERISPAVRLFVERGLVRDEERARFDGIVASTMRLRNSIVVEIVLLVAIFTGGHALASERFAAGVDSWARAAIPGGPPAITNAGLCYAWWSLPLFQFLLLRWWYRLLLWALLLWRVSKLNLDLTPTHPDRAGGLSFLGISTAAFAPLILAQSALVSAMVGGRILQSGATLKDFKFELGGVLAFALLLALGPLLVFVPILTRARRRALIEYGLLANRYVREFDFKWVRGGAPESEPLVGSSDIQSLADLANSFEVIREMKPFPFGKEVVLQLVVMAALPCLPLALTVMPLEELVKRLLKALF